MRVAEICPDCPVYYNAACIIYNGVYLPILDVSPLDSLDSILQKVNDAYKPLTGTGSPTSIPKYIGQFYIDTSVPYLYIGLGTTSVNWGSVGTIVTTTTTTTLP